MPVPSPDTRRAAASHGGTVAFLLDIIPGTMIGAFANGAMLQVILIALLCGIALVQLGDKAKPLVEVIDASLHMLFRIVGMVMRLAPLGAGAGVAYTLGRARRRHALVARLPDALGLRHLRPVRRRGAGQHRPAGPASRCCNFLRYFKDELLVTLATCSTEAVLPRMMAKLERLGCARPVVGLVLPTGYAFNADGTAIYLTMAAVFIAQATNTPLDLGHQLVILGVLLLTSKGSAGVAGAGFITLAATLSSVGTVPVAGLVLLLGVDRFMNKARAVVNLIGNGVATIAIARWDQALDMEKVRQVIREQRGESSPRITGPVHVTDGVEAQS